jgi:TRAP-type transport system periplasmic protein
MHKFIYLILAIMLAIIFATSGCTGETATPSATQPDTTTTTTSQPSTGETIELRFSTFIPPADVLAVTMENWAKDLEEQTDGRIEVTFFHSGSLASVPESLDAVSSGTADIAMLNTVPFPDRLPLSQVMGMPLMLFNSSEDAALAWWTLYNKYPEMQAEYTDKGIKVLWITMPGPNHIEGNKEIKTLDDLKGLKVGTETREEAKAFELFGASPVTVAGGEKYTSLERNVIDSSGQNFNGSRIWKTYQVATSFTENVDISFRVCPIAINLESYNNLPEDLKAIFDEATDGEAVSRISGQGNDNANAEAREIVDAYHKEHGNPGIYRLPDEEKAKLRELAMPINEEWVAEMEAKGLPGQAIFDDIQAMGAQ